MQLDCALSHPLLTLATQYTTSKVQAPCQLGYHKTEPLECHYPDDIRMNRPRCQ